MMFPGLELRPPVFYNWHIGIRFELGLNDDYRFIYRDCPYIQSVYKRAIALFEASHLHYDRPKIDEVFHHIKN